MIPRIRSFDDVCSALSRDVSRAVFAVIGHDDDDIRGQQLTPERVDRGGDSRLFVVRGDQYGDLRTVRAAIDASIATLNQLHERGDMKAEEVAKAIKSLGVNPDKIDPLYA